MFTELLAPKYRQKELHLKATEPVLCALGAVEMNP